MGLIVVTKFSSPAGVPGKIWREAKAKHENRVEIENTRNTSTAHAEPKKEDVEALLACFLQLISGRQND